MLLKLKRTPGIYLIGFMGSGKSEVGRLLAHELGWSFVDLDEEIETSEGVSIAEIFDDAAKTNSARSSGSVAQAVREIECGKPMVIALGGGAFVDPGQSQACSQSAASPYGWIARSSASRARLKGSNHRPLARDPEKFQQLYDDRREAYGHAELSHRSRHRRSGALWPPFSQLPIF